MFIYVGLILFLTSKMFAASLEPQTNPIYIPNIYRVDDEMQLIRQMIGQEIDPEETIQMPPEADPNEQILLTNYPLLENESRLFRDQIATGSLHPKALTIHITDQAFCKCLHFNIAEEFSDYTETYSLVSYDIWKPESITFLKHQEDTTREPEWIEIKLEDLQHFNTDEINPKAILIVEKLKEALDQFNLKQAEDEQVAFEEYLQIRYNDCLRENIRRFRATL